MLQIEQYKNFAQELEQFRNLAQDLQNINEYNISEEQSVRFFAFLEHLNQTLEYSKKALIFGKLEANLWSELDMVYRKVIPRWHFAMLNDVERNDAFERAIKGTVHDGCTVLDVGTGSGLLAMMAARHGAHFVTSCEMVRPIAYLAKKIVALNGFEDRIKIVPKKSQDLLIGQDLPKQADILVTETIDCGLVGEGILPIIRHARQLLLTKEATIVPARAVIKFSLLESSVIYNLNVVSNAANFDVSAFNTFSSGGYFPVRLSTWSHRLLSKPTTAFEFNFQIDSLKPRQQQMFVQAEHSGICHGIVFWFELDLGHGVFLSNAVNNEKSHWMQAMQCFQEPIVVHEGDLLELTVRQDDTNIDFQVTKVLDMNSSLANLAKLPVISTKFT